MHCTVMFREGTERKDLYTRPFYLSPLEEHLDFSSPIEPFPRLDATVNGPLVSWKRGSFLTTDEACIFTQRRFFFLFFFSMFSCNDGLSLMVSSLSSLRLDSDGTKKREDMKRFLHARWDILIIIFHQSRYFLHI